MNKKLLVSFDDVCVTFGNFVALEHLFFQVYTEDLIALIGPNGSGKTTLLKTILGIYRPVSGRLSRYTKKIGYVPQRISFDKTIPITVYELLKVYSGQKKDRIKKSLQEINFGHSLDKQIGSLSGGELQRVLIANALLQEPDLLLLDEATAGIDVKGESGFYELLQRIHKTYTLGIVMVSHDIHTVNKYATMVHCLNKTFICHGKLVDIEKQKAFQELFGLSVTRYHHHHG